MNCERAWLKKGALRSFVALFLLVSYVFTFSVNEKAFAEPSLSASTITPLSLTLSSDIATVAESFVSSEKDAPTLFLIQDAHLHYEVQQNIASILKSLTREYDVSQILIEGAEGEQDVSLFRGMPLKELSRTLYERYLREGRISGPEAFAILSPKTVELFGVDSEKTYQKNIESFIACDASKHEATLFLEEMRSVLENVAEGELSQELRDLVTQKMESRTKNMIFYVSYLNEKAQARAFSLDEFPAFRLMHSLEKSEELDFQKSTNEMRRLINDFLLPVISSEDGERLAGFELDRRGDFESERTYCAKLEGLCETYAIPFQKFEHCARYYAFLKSVVSLNARDILKDSEAIEKRLIESIARTTSERELMAWYSDYMQLEKILSLQGTRDDVRHFARLERRFSTESMTDFLMRYNVHDQGDLRHERKDLFNQYAEFYALAEAREESVVKNTLNALKASGKKLGVLVLGGYHTQGLTRRMQEENISYIVLTPTIRSDEGSSRYTQVMSSYSDHFGVREGARGGTVKELSSLNPAIDKRLYGELLVDMTRVVSTSIDTLLSAYEGGSVSVRELKLFFRAEVTRVLNAILHVEGYDFSDDTLVKKEAVKPLVASVWNALVKERLVLYDEALDEYRVLKAASLVTGKAAHSARQLRLSDERLFGTKTSEASARTFTRFYDMLYAQGKISFERLASEYEARDLSPPKFTIEALYKRLLQRDAESFLVFLKEHGYSFSAFDRAIIEEFLIEESRREAFTKGIPPSVTPLTSKSLATIPITHQVVRDVQNADVLYVAPELGNLAQTGGLGIVSLEGVYWTEQVLARTGRHIIRILPFFKWTQNPESKGVLINYQEKGWSVYSVTDENDKPLEFTITIDGVPYVTRVNIGQQKGDGIWNIMLDNDVLSEYPYKTLSPADWSKTQAVWLSQGVLRAAQLLKLKARVLHISDWQTGLIPEYLDTDEFRDLGKNVSVIAALHNGKFHGRGGPDSYSMTGLPLDRYTFDRIEMLGDWATLKGFQKADYVYTVSKTHALELQDDTKEGAYGLQGMFRHLASEGRFGGMINGIDYREWGFEEGENKESYRARLQALLAAQGKTIVLDPARPLLISTSRLSAQKGMNLVQKVLPRLIKEYNVQFVQVGTTAGDRTNDPNGNALADGFRALEEEYPDSVGAFLYFSMPLVRTAFGAADLVLDPTYFEPCGLNYMFAMRYKALTVGRAVGGLVDVIIDPLDDRQRANGFLFKTDSNDEELLIDLLYQATARALDIKRTDPAEWEQIKENAFQTDSSWENRVGAVIEVYENIGLRSGDAFYPLRTDAFIHALAAELGVSIPFDVAIDRASRRSFVQQAYEAPLQKIESDFSEVRVIAELYMRLLSERDKGRDKDEFYEIIVSALERGAHFQRIAYASERKELKRAIAVSYDYFNQRSQYDINFFRSRISQGGYQSVIVFVEENKTGDYTYIRERAHIMSGNSFVHVVPISPDVFSSEVPSFQFLGDEIIEKYDIISVLGSSFRVPDDGHVTLESFLRQAWINDEGAMKNKVRLVGGSWENAITVISVLGTIKKWVDAEGVLTDEAQVKLGFFLLSSKHMSLFGWMARQGVIQSNHLREALRDKIYEEQRLNIIKQFA